MHRMSEMYDEDYDEKHARSFYVDRQKKARSP